MSVQENHYLETIPHTGNGVTKDKKRRFFHSLLSYTPSAKVIFDWKTGDKALKKEKKQDTYTLPLYNPEKFFNSHEDGIVWLGHASFYIRIDGVTLLTDPVYYKLPLIRTISELKENPISQIKDLDYVLISHDHRDHFDVRTLKKISKIFPNTRVLTGLNMKSLFKKFHFKEIQCAGWYQKYTLDTSLSIYFLPAKHRSRRGLFDTNKRLWGSFIIKGKNKTLYFGGDSGYDQHFKEIGELFPKIDYAFLGIGAYLPKLFSKKNHTSPEEAVQAGKDLKTENIIPMHYGTFDITNEPPSQPARLFTKAVEEEQDIIGLLLGLGEHIPL